MVQLLPMLQMLQMLQIVRVATKLVKMRLCNYVLRGFITAFVPFDINIVKLFISRRFSDLYGLNNHCHKLRVYQVTNTVERIFGLPCTCA